MVRVFAHGAIGSILHAGPIELLCSTTGVNKVVVCTVLSVA